MINLYDGHFEKGLTAIAESGLHFFLCRDRVKPFSGIFL
jgi:hypothetical protein